MFYYNIFFSIFSQSSNMDIVKATDSIRLKLIGCESYLIFNIIITITTSKYPPHSGA